MKNLKFHLLKYSYIIITFVYKLKICYILSYKFALLASHQSLNTALKYNTLYTSHMFIFITLSNTTITHLISSLIVLKTTTKNLSYEDIIYDRWHISDILRSSGACDGRGISATNRRVNVMHSSGEDIESKCCVRVCSLCIGIIKHRTE